MSKYIKLEISEEFFDLPLVTQEDELLELKHLTEKLDVCCKRKTEVLFHRNEMSEVYLENITIVMKDKINEYNNKN